ncbi:MAG: dihydropteroate synthase [Pseudomonadota bacterium]
MNTAWIERRDRFLTTLPRRPQVMGILNVTPDSFSDGGRFNTLDAAMAQAERMVVEGCDLLDIGGESTRPGATVVSESEELDRVCPVVEALSSAFDTPLSIDTYKANVARAAVEAGAVIVNDVWGFQKDPEMARVVAETQTAAIVMHNRNAADPSLDIMSDMRSSLERSLALAKVAGVPEARLLVDPGIGFGRTPEQSLECIKRLDELTAWFGHPVLLGLSRKRFIGHVLGNEVDDRLNGTIAANMMGLWRGARVLRVHDVKPHVEAVQLFEAIASAS